MISWTKIFKNQNLHEILEILSTQICGNLIYEGKNYKLFLI